MAGTLNIDNLRVSNGNYLISNGDFSNNSISTKHLALGCIETYFNDEGISFSSRKNRIINGSMKVCQRGSNTSNFSNGYSSVDRWYINRDLYAANATTQQITHNNRQWLKIQRVNGDTNTQNINIYQPLESEYTSGLNGRNVTISFKMIVGAECVNIPFTINILYSNNTVDVGPSSNSWLMLSGNTQSCNVDNTPLLFSQTLTIPETAGQLMPMIQLNTSSNTAGNTHWWGITDIQLELGKIATFYDMKTYDEYLSDCLRYYEVINDFNIGNYVSSNNDYIMETYPLKSSKRSTPNITSNILSNTNFSHTTFQTSSTNDNITITVYPNGSGMCSVNYSSIVLDSELY